MGKKLRWGIVGCAGIAVNAVIPGIRQSEHGEVTAIASRGLEKAKETAEKLAIPKAYGSYEELIADGDIDAVYIPLPNHLHKEWTIRAARAGKHILCEKPLALNAEDAEEMVRAAKEAGVVLEEAFMYRHHPRYARAKEIAHSGEIGDIRGVHGVFTFNNAGDKGNIRYRKEWGGGGVYDVGCYPINAARYILGREPVAATAHALFSPEHDDVDMMTAGLVEFAGGVALTFDCGMWTSFRQTFEIAGSDGHIVVSNAFVTGGDEAVLHIQGKNGARTETIEGCNHYALQADDFARSVLFGEAQQFPPADAVANMKVIDACLESARQHKRVEIR